MRLLFSTTATQRLLTRPKPAWTSSNLNKIIHRRMAHVLTGPPHLNPPQITLEEKKARIVHLLDLTSHFGDLFHRSPPDLSEQLLSTITPTPGVNCAMALVHALCSAEPVDASIRSVVQVLPRTADVFVVNDSFIDECEPQTFQDEVIRLTTLSVSKDLERLYMHQFTDNPKDWTFDGALFSASAVKNGLIDHPSIYAFTRYGLQLPPFPKYHDPNWDAVAIGAVGACLQLITAGDVFMEKHFTKSGVGLADIIAALEALKAKRLIEHQGERDLLDKTIEAAKDNFANPISASDAWKLLGIFRTCICCGKSF